MIRTLLGLNAAVTTTLCALPAMAHEGAGAAHMFTQADHMALLAGSVVVGVLAFVIWRFSRS